MNTMQHEFDEVVKHMYKQGKPAQRDGGICVYRGKEGSMCAVGCRIPDATYTPDMEGNPTHDLIEHFGSKLPAEIVAYADMFEQLQQVHDNWTFGGNDSIITWNDWLAHRLPAVAQQFGLTFTKPE